MGSGEGKEGERFGYCWGGGWGGYIRATFLSQHWKKRVFVISVGTLIKI